MAADVASASTFPSLSTRQLGVPGILHPASCCPSMDVALISDPPSTIAQSTSNGSHIRLYRLSGGSTATTAIEEGSKSAISAAFAKARAATATSDGGASKASGSAQVWETDIPAAVEKKKIASVPALPLKKDVKGKGRASQAQQLEAAAPEPPSHLPESISWSPDGQLLAFGSSTSDLKLYSVHDGKPILKSVRLSPSESTSSGSNLAHEAEQAAAGALYLLAWQDCEAHIARESILAEDLGNALPGLPSLAKVEEAKPKKANIFANPFMHPGLNKPFVPAVPFDMPAFPSLPPVHPSSPGAPSTEAEEIEDSIIWIEEEGVDGSAAKTESTSILFAGDEHGRLHLLYGGSTSLGSISLGADTDIISAFLNGPPTVSQRKTPFTPRESYATTLSILISVPLATAHESDVPDVILDALDLPAPSATNKKGRLSSVAADPADESGAQAVLRLTVVIPSFPSPELSLLSRASSSISALLAHAFEALDGARQLWEESQDLARKWVDRLRDDDHSGAEEGKVPELKLLLLLLTGRPVDTDMHDYFANKNSERNLERWETTALKATLKLRNTCYMSITPVCERILLWLDQLRGYCLWQSRFGHLHLEQQLIEECVPLVQAIMLNAARLEALSLDEELGFRDLVGWLKFELERISGIEAQAETRPVPKHDVLAVTTYLKTNLPANPIDPLIRVDSPAERKRSEPAVQEWVDAVLEARNLENVKQEGKEALEKLMAKMRKEVARFEARVAASTDRPLEVDVDEDDENGNNLDELLLQADKLFVEPPLWHPPPVPAPVAPSAARRKSGSAASAQLPPTIPPQEPVNPMALPLPVYLHELASRLSRFLQQAFESATSQAEITSAKKVVTWSPPDREEDDAITALGLARDPTKITSRVIVSTDEEDGSSTARHWIACETPAGILGDNEEQAAFWIVCIDHDGTAYGSPFTLQHDNQNSLDDFKILDVEFFDDTEVALLLRFPGKGNYRPSHALATVNFPSLEQLVPLEGGLINFAQFPELSPLPIARIHRFSQDIEPLQFALNGRKSRRIGCILGAQGKILEVLDMDTEDPEEIEEDQAEEFPDDAGSVHMEFPDLLGGQDADLEAFEMEHGLTNGHGGGALLRPGSDEL